MAKKPELKIPVSTKGHVFKNGVHLAAHTFPAVARNRVGAPVAFLGDIVTKVELFGVAGTNIARFEAVEVALDAEDVALLNKVCYPLGIEEGEMAAFIKEIEECRAFIEGVLK